MLPLLPRCIEACFLRAHITKASQQVDGHKSNPSATSKSAIQTTPTWHTYSVQVHTVVVAAPT